MPIALWNGTAWAPAKAIPIWNGTSWVPTKKVKTWDGTTWKLTWVPPVTGLTITFSKTPVETNELFNVTVSYPAGYPEGTAVRITTSTGYDQTIVPAEGSTSVVVTGVKHVNVSTPTWYAVATNLGGVSPQASKVQTVVAPVAAHFHEKVPTGATGSQIQAAMNRAYDWFMANKNAAVNFADEQTFACVELAASGTYNLGTTVLKFRRGVRLVGAGTGTTRPLVRASTGSHLGYVDDNGGGGYNSPHYDWLISNIRFDCVQYSGGFSTAHIRRFQIEKCDFLNLGGVKHFIEINSSGGAFVSGTYNCRVINCYFTMPNKATTNGKARRTEDEPIQLDYSWDGAAPNVANDGTVTNNVLIDGCTFYRTPRGFGGHHYEEGAAGEHYPLGMHTGVLVQNCTFDEVNPDLYGDGSNGSGSEGAFRAYFWRNVQVINNVFDTCHQPINFYIQDGATTRHGNPGIYTVRGNTIRNKTSTRPGINSTSAHASLRHDRADIDGNIVDQAWGGTDYMVAMEDTSAVTLPNSANTVLIRNNIFRPTAMSVADEKAYNKYRAKGANNAGPVTITNNTVSDGSVDNS